MSAGVTRRTMFGGCTAGTLLFGAAGAGKAAELDGELLQLVARLEAVQASIDRIDSGGSNALLDDQDLDDELDALQVDEFWPTAEAIMATSARTPEGIRAKAKAARIIWLSVENEPEYEANGRAVFSLLRDILGEG